MLLYSFDPHKYTKNSSELCDILNREDVLGMRTLVERFVQQIKYNGGFYDHIVALQAPSGGGKSFFLALLYCKILNDENKYPLKYIDILDYVADDNAQRCIDDIEQLSDKEAHTSVVLLDNLDKHTPKFIYEFIHLLHRLTSRENFLFVLAYDYRLLNGKLSKYLGDDNEIEGYLQGHIHLDFFLDIENLDVNSIIREKDLEILREDIIAAHETGLLSLKQVVIALAKLEIYQSNNDNISIEEILIAFKLIIIKLTCKMLYIAILQGKEFDCDNEKLNDFRNILEDKINSYNSGQFGGDSTNIDVKQIAQKMEISNV